MVYACTDTSASLATGSATLCPASSNLATGSVAISGASKPAASAASIMGPKPSHTVLEGSFFLLIVFEWPFAKRAGPHSASIPAGSLGFACTPSLASLPQVSPVSGSRGVCKLTERAEVPMHDQRLAFSSSVSAPSTEVALVMICARRGSISCIRGSTSSYFAQTWMTSPTPCTSLWRGNGDDLMGYLPRDLRPNSRLPVGAIELDGIPRYSACPVHYITAKVPSEFSGACNIVFASGTVGLQCVVRKNSGRHRHTITGFCSLQTQKAHLAREFGRLVLHVLKRAFWADLSFGFRDSDSERFLDPTSSSSGLSFRTGPRPTTIIPSPPE